MNTATLAVQLAGFVAAPLLQSVVNRTKALLAGRRGAPLLQPYYDLWKLLRKGAVYSQTTTWLFRLGPLLGLSAIATALLLVPVGKLPAPFTFGGDIFVLAALLALGRFATVTAALDTGSSFEEMGGSREVTFAVLAEPAFFLTLAVLALVTRSLSLTDMLGPGLADAWRGGIAPALVLAMGALGVVLLAENSRIPFDDPNTHLELTMVHEVMVLDHSGPDLAFILYGASLKLFLFAGLLASMVLPFHTGSAAGDALVYFAGVLMVGIVLGLIESLRARVRMPQAPQVLLAAMLFGALGMTLALAVR